MMHVVKKVVHVKIEKLVKTIGKIVRRCSITVRLVFVCQRLTNRYNNILSNVIE